MIFAGFKVGGNGSNDLFPVFPTLYTFSIAKSRVVFFEEVNYLFRNCRSYVYGFVCNFKRSILLQLCKPVVYPVDKLIGLLLYGIKATLQLRKLLCAAPRRKIAERLIRGVNAIMATDDKRRAFGFNFSCATICPIGKNKVLFRRV